MKTAQLSPHPTRSSSRIPPPLIKEFAAWFDNETEGLAMRANVTTPVIAPNQPENFFDLLGQGVCEATFDLALRFFARQKVLSGMSGGRTDGPASELML